MNNSRRLQYYNTKHTTICSCETDYTILLSKFSMNKVKTGSSEGRLKVK